jgi:hypothetical protein
MSEEQLLAIAERAQLIAERAYDARMDVRDRVEISIQRIEASLALLVRVRAHRV